MKSIVSIAVRERRAAPLQSLSANELQSSSPLSLFVFAAILAGIVYCCRDTIIVPCSRLKCLA